MTSLTTARDAVRQDIPALQSFECTVRPERSAATGWKPYHPKPWEFRVQSLIRDIRPPTANHIRVLVGEDEDGLAWVQAYEQIDGPAVVQLVVGAVALRHRGANGRVSDEMLDATFDDIFGRALEADVDEVIIFTHVDGNNLPSQRMCSRSGLVHVDVTEDGLQVWARTLPVRGSGLRRP